MATLLAATPAWAAYEVSTYTADIPTNTPTQWTDDLNVTLDKPDTGTDTFTGFVYLWSRGASLDSSTSLTKEASSSFGDLGGFFAASALSSNDQAIITLDKTNFTDDDSGDVWYLHVATQYLDQGNNYAETYSSTVNIGPFNVDNVVEGTIAVVDADGNTLTETRETRLNVKVAGPSYLANFYLAETAIKPTTATTVPDDNIVTYDLTDTTTGSRTLYAWFEDQAGNVNASPATASFTLLPSVSISPNTVTIDLATTTTQVFSIDGSSAGYDWSVTSGTDVCSLSGTITDTTSVTLTALKEGTCTLQAALHTDSTQTLSTGTITVTKSGASISIPLHTGWNLISISVTPSDTAPASVLAGIDGKYTIVWGDFDPTTSTWQSYNPDKPKNSLSAIQPQHGYWIKMTEDATLDVSGSLPSTSIALKQGWNLVGFSLTKSTDITTVLSGISGNYSIVWGDYDTTTSTWKSYNPAKPKNSLDSLSPGYGYWIKMDSDATLNY